ncbi:nitroreductase family protein [Anaerocolumna xylanovorans]|uniref:Nitroreductase n=1 Tax=Anaerocolumna xylanovorans DSM 12503 TaxID=1121345 RepID=A0A1M7XXQ1_9FIRM|nr:nitroreductase family protein [Anaerocolumna xylanovorans]SHO43744.1 Nitroreductase [Anaerocolumna xylanovorans DSM 12503]
MNFISLAKERYSLRKFSDKPVEKEKLELVLNAGQLAPTAGNLQPQRILIIESSEALEKLKKCTPCHFNAPVALLVCYDNAASAKRSYDNYDTGEADASIVATHLMLQITDLGLGSTWVAHFDPAAVRKEFSLPKHFIPVALLPMGYPAEDAAPNQQMHNHRKPLADTVFYNHF